MDCTIFQLLSRICIFVSPTLITYILFEPLVIASPVPNISAIPSGSCIFCPFEILALENLKEPICPK